MTEITITKKLVHEIFTAKMSGMNTDEIAKQYPFSSWTVREILKRSKGEEFKITAEMNEYVLPKSQPRKAPEKRAIINAVMSLVEAKRDFQRAVIDAHHSGLTKNEVNRIIHPMMEVDNGH